MGSPFVCVSLTLLFFIQRTILPYSTPGDALTWCQSIPCSVHMTPVSDSLCSHDASQWLALFSWRQSVTRSVHMTPVSDSLCSHDASQWLALFTWRQSVTCSVHMTPVSDSLCSHDASQWLALLTWCQSMTCSVHMMPVNDLLCSHDASQCLALLTYHSLHGGVSKRGAVAMEIWVHVEVRGQLGDGCAPSWCGIFQQHVEVLVQVHSPAQQYTQELMGTYALTLPNNSTVVLVQVHSLPNNSTEVLVHVYSPGQQ